MKTPFLKTMFAIIRKDLRAELRSRELVSAMLVFALLSVLIFSFALELDRITRREAVSGVLWVTVAFASLLGLNRSMTSERELGNMDAMLMAPVSRAAILCGKLVGNFLFTTLVGLGVLAVLVVLFDLSPRPLLLLLLALGILGFATVGTVLAAMTAQTRAREALLPVIMLPMALPMIIAAVNATTGILNDAPAAQWQSWLNIIAAIDLIYFALSVMLFGFVVEE